MRTGVIYALLEPESLEPRYVGQTVKTPERRRDEHVKGARNVKNTSHVARWIRKLPAPPHVSVLEVVLEDDLDAAEMLWISVMRSGGVKLCNMNDGGGGQRGFIHSAETRAKLSEISSLRVGRNVSIETRDKISAAGKARYTPEERARHSIIMSTVLKSKHRIPWNKGKKDIMPLETRAKISASVKLRFSEPEQRTLMSARARGRVMSTETRAKISATLTKPIEAAVVIDRYKHGETLAEIGRDLHVSNKRIRQVLVDNGIIIRRRGERQ